MKGTGVVRSKVTLAVLVVLAGVASILQGIAVPARSAPLPPDGSLGDATAAVIGDGDGGTFGAFVESGDLTGDGIADVVVGAPFEGEFPDPGRVYVFEGGGGLAGTLKTKDAFASFEGEDCGPEDLECQVGISDWADQAGEGGGVGDVDGDGNDDLVVTGSGIDGDESPSGGAYIFYGPLEEGTPERPTLEPDAKLRGEAKFDSVGRFEAEIGDIDADGHPDIVIGAEGRNGLTGSVYIVYGNGEKLEGDVRLGGGCPVGQQPCVVELAGTPGIDRFLGRHMAIGQLDDSEGRDLIVCAEASLAVNGRCYILYGGVRETEGPILIASDARINGAQPGEIMCCATVADLDANGLDDLVILGYGADAMTGYAAIFYSDTSQLIPSDSRLAGDLLSTESDATIKGNAIGDAAGFYASAGDLNADGVTDLVVNAQCENKVCTLPGQATSGALYVFYGTAGTRLQSDHLINPLTMSEGEVRIVSHHPGDGAGFWFAANGDVTGDGVDDLAVGAPTGCDDPDFQDGSCNTMPGAVYVVAGGCLDPHKNHDKPQHCQQQVR